MERNLHIEKTDLENKIESDIENISTNTNNVVNDVENLHKDEINSDEIETMIDNNSNENIIEEGGVKSFKMELKEILMKHGIENDDLLEDLFQFCSLSENLEVEYLVPSDFSRVKEILGYYVTYPVLEKYINENLPKYNKNISDIIDIWGLVR